MAVQPNHSIRTKSIYQFCSKCAHHCRCFFCFCFCFCSFDASQTSCQTYRYWCGSNVGKTIFQIHARKLERCDAPIHWYSTHWTVTNRNNLNFWIANWILVAAESKNEKQNRRWKTHTHTRAFKRRKNDGCCSIHGRKYLFMIKNRKLMERNIEIVYELCKTGRSARANERRRLYMLIIWKRSLSRT